VRVDGGRYLDEEKKIQRRAQGSNEKMGSGGKKKGRKRETKER
jgi:hypothetical protein